MKKLTAKQARELFRYTKSTGRLVWRTGHRKGQDVGITNFEGRRAVIVNGRSVSVRRIIWLMVIGKWPARQVCVRNGDRTDLAWRNLTVG